MAIMGHNAVYGIRPTINSDTGKSSSKVWIGLTVPFDLGRVGLL